MQKLYINHEHISFIKKKNKIPKTKYRRKTKILHSSNPDVALINLYSQNLKSLIPASLIFIPERGRLHSLPVLRRLPVAAVSCLQRKQEIRSPQRLHGGIRRLEMREMRRERSHPMPALLNKKKKKKEKRKKEKKIKRETSSSLAIGIERNPLPSLYLRLRCYEKYIACWMNTSRWVITFSREITIIRDRGVLAFNLSLSLFLFSFRSIGRGRIVEGKISSRKIKWHARTHARTHFEYRAFEAMIARSLANVNCKITTNKTYL